MDDSDDDQFLLDQVLNNLYDFGDGAGSGSRQRKKLKKRPLEAVEEVCGDTGDSKTEHLAVEHSQGTPVTEPPRIPKTEVEVVTFQDPIKKARVQQKPPSDFLKMVPKVNDNEEANQDDPDELMFEKTRLEVHRFGLGGYKKEQQRSFEQERAIMLGARPPKKQYVNYKTLQQDFQDRKAAAKEDTEPQASSTSRMAHFGSSEDKLKKKKKGTTMPSVFGSRAGSASMGRFKGGMLMLNSKEIEKINGPR
ncbi:hypothetical protein NHX12_027432 [Muraenolepis orangiensis]|uniref:Uncharacterized protein n=1 Tax=Muraenolepis orangiensis TaxID=630683 RepID=A0A9Q0EDR0_9TELE|nr:hypothetical protein NHX12_027432 [Muraenolepis orangiensis]